MKATRPNVPAEQRVQITSQDVARFWSKVDKSPTCWLWTDRPNSSGYGLLGFRRELKAYAHRLAVHLTRGPIPAGMELDHICRVRHCVNPDHLEPVTHRTNGLRGIAPAAVNARKTQCIHGHEFSPANTYRNPNTGNRACRECRRLHDAARSPRRRPATTQWRDA